MARAEKAVTDESPPASLNRDWIVIALMGLVAGLTSALVLFASPWGIGVGYDSYFYLSAAQTLSDGIGLGRIHASGAFIPLTHFPPLYPTSITLVTQLSGSPSADAARWLQALLAGLLPVSVGLAAARSHGRWVGLAGAVYVAASPVLFARHLWAMSESVFYLVLVANWLALAAFTRRPSIRLAGVGGALAGLGYLTRYAGVSIVGMWALVWLLLPHNQGRSRWITLAAFALACSLAVLPWVVRNQLLDQALTNRSLVFHPPTLDQFKEAGRALASWLPVSQLPLWLRLGAVLIVGGGLSTIPLLAWRDESRGEHRAVFGWPAIIPLAFAGAYLAMLLLSLTLFDASTPLDSRILSPIYLALVVSALFTLPTLVAAASRRLRLALAGAGLLVFFVFANATYVLAADGRADGLGFNSRAWRRSPTVAAVRELPSDILIYSNESFPVSFHTGRPVFSVPERLDPVQSSERPDWEQAVAEMHVRLAQTEGVLVLIHPNELRVEMPPIETLTMGLVPLMEANDGTIYISRDSHQPSSG